MDVKLKRKEVAHQCIVEYVHTVGVGLVDFLMVVAFMNSFHLYVNASMVLALDLMEMIATGQEHIGPLECFTCFLQ